MEALLSHYLEAFAIIMFAIGFSILLFNNTLTKVKLLNVVLKPKSIEANIDNIRQNIFIQI